MKLISYGYTWLNDQIYIENDIMVLFEFYKIPKNISGVCTDKPIKFKINGKRGI